MIHLIIAIVIGAVIAAAGGFALDSALNTAATGTRSNASLYQYGSR
jgi:hypothetical protein